MPPHLLLMLTRSSHSDVAHKTVTVTPARQQPFVQLGDLFPFGADVGVEAEMRFYDPEKK